MSNSYKGLMVVIPTRNRASLAINAILSVLNQPNCGDIKILVSDNSTDLNEVETLFQFCQENNDERLNYIKPTKPLCMTKHWDWAINQALEKYNANHFLYLTDRMLFKADQLKEVINIIKRYSSDIIFYHHDRIKDDTKPIKLEHMNWTGKIYRVKSTRLLYLSSQSILHPLPKMLNSVTPRNILNQILSKYQNIFSSISPDYNFCYRSLEVVESVLYFDKAPIVHYALSRSNGASLSKGVKSQDLDDFIANLGQLEPCSSAPIPCLKTVGNAIFHEYCFVKKETGSDKFPDINMNSYLSYLSNEINEIVNFENRLEMKKIISFYQENNTIKNISASSVEKIIKKIFKNLLKPISGWNKIVIILSKNKLIQKAFLFLGYDFGIRPPAYADCHLNFDTTEQAIDYMNNFPITRLEAISTNLHIEELFETDAIDIF
ncbi:MAG: glycosyltransferase [Synechocystis sp.]|jgi:hypothetical protein